ncbi:MAG: hypothetical protein U0169_12370 [Polyangiaceae bacterium]
MTKTSRRFGTILVGILPAAALVAACGGATPAARVAKAPPCIDGGLGPANVAVEPDKPVPFEGAMALVEASEFTNDLIAVGLDPKNLPPLDKLTRPQLGRVMKTFSYSLGIPCIGCHDQEKFEADTPRKRVARHMWNDFVRVLAIDDAAGGGTLYCDSCHQGRVLTLDRKDKKLVADYMDDVFVARLKKIKSGEDHDCGSCHGDPPEFHIVDEWKKKGGK